MGNSSAILLLVLACARGDVDEPGATTDTVVDSDGLVDSSTPTRTTDTGAEVPAVALLGVPVVSEPTEPLVHLVRLLSLSTNVPATVALTLEDGIRTRDVVFPTEATEHTVPLLGLLEDTVTDVTVTVTAADGTTDTASVEVALPPLDLVLPDIVLRAGAPEASEPGYTLMTAWSADVADLLLAVDAEGRVAWAFEAPGTPKAVQLWPDGRLTHLSSHKLWVRTMAGDFIALYASRDLDGATRIDDLLHHEAYFPGDGTFWSLRGEPLKVEAYPVDEWSPHELASATIQEDRVVHYDEDGTLLGEWSTAALLDTRRIGFGSVDVMGSGNLDWSHSNAVVPLDGGTSFLVSVRHQDAIVKVDAETGALDWILSNPDGWPADLGAKRLAPIGELTWPYHAHGVKAVGDLLYLFDNGNDYRTTPYSQSPHPDGLFTRLVAYRVDEAARTVEQVFALTDTPDGPLYANALGNVQVLPSTGHVLGTYSYLSKEHGVRNTDIGRGTHSTRLLEWDVDAGTVVWDLSISGLETETPAGWLVDRATRVPSLYLGVAEESWR